MLRVPPLRALTAAISLAVGALGGCEDPSSNAPSNTALGYETHTPNFPLASGAHLNIDCNQCHGAFDSFTKFDCLGGCHAQSQTDPPHAGVSGYAYASDRCYACHPTGEGVDHRPFFPILGGDAHAGLACGDCHTNPAVRSEVSCNACHAHPVPAVDAQHSRVGGYATTSGLCLRCHADSQVDGVLDHLPFRITSATDHYRTPCFDCHPAMRADKPWATDFAAARVECLSCHPRIEMDDKHQGFSGYQYQTQSCLQSACHANGSKPED